MLSSRSGGIAQHEMPFGSDFSELTMGVNIYVWAREPRIFLHPFNSEHLSESDSGKPAKD